MAKNPYNNRILQHMVNIHMNLLANMKTSHPAKIKKSKMNKVKKCDTKKKKAKTITSFYAHFTLAQIKFVPYPKNS